MKNAMTTEPRIILEGITLDDFFSRLQREESPKSLIDENLNVEEAARFLKISVPTVHRLKAAGKIPFKKIGHRVVYVKSDLVRWLAKK